METMYWLVGLFNWFICVVQFGEKFKSDGSF
jgi:hypothetical protein